MVRLINFGAFYLGWFACVVGAARGLPFAGPAVVVALIGVHLLLAPHRVSELRLIAAVGALGFLIDSVQAALGVFTFAGQPGVWLCPLWLASLWLIFATTLNGSMNWLTGRYAVGAALGAISGPLSYCAAVRIGVIEFPSVAVSVTALALVWALTVPTLLLLRDWIALRSPVALPVQ
jgi:hypothetical protein